MRKDDWDVNAPLVVLWQHYFGDVSIQEVTLRRSLTQADIGGLEAELRQEKKRAEFEERRIPEEIARVQEEWWALRDMWWWVPQYITTSFEEYCMSRNKVIAKKTSREAYSEANALQRYLTQAREAYQKQPAEPIAATMRVARRVRIKFNEVLDYLAEIAGCPYRLLPDEL